MEISLVKFGGILSHQFSSAEPSGVKQGDSSSSHSVALSCGRRRKRTCSQWRLTSDRTIQLLAPTSWTNRYKRRHADRRLYKSSVSIAWMFQPDMKNSTASTSAAIFHICTTSRNTTVIQSNSEVSQTDLSRQLQAEQARRRYISARFIASPDWVELHLFTDAHKHIRKYFITDHHWSAGIRTAEVQA